jgi:hypothetical protein
MTVGLRHCTICALERFFEQPPCLDEHDPDCPEWVCVECGAALLVGVLDAAAGARVA